MGDQPCQTLKPIIVSTAKALAQEETQIHMGIQFTEIRHLKPGGKENQSIIGVRTTGQLFRKKKKNWIHTSVECQNKFQKDQWFQCKNKSINYQKKTQEIFLLSEEWVRAFSYSKSRIHKEKSNIVNQKLLCGNNIIGKVTKQTANWENIRAIPIIQRG